MPVAKGKLIIGIKTACSKTKNDNFATKKQPRYKPMKRLLTPIIKHCRSCGFVQLDFIRNLGHIHASIYFFCVNCV